MPGEDGGEGGGEASQDPVGRRRKRYSRQEEKEEEKESWGAWGAEPPRFNSSKTVEAPHITFKRLAILSD